MREGRILHSASGARFENWFFTEQRILVAASMMTITYAICLAWGLFLHKGYTVSHGRCVDFTTMWVSGHFAGSSNPIGIYDDSAWHSAWKDLTGLSGCLLAQRHTSYPPTLLFFTYILGFMPYSVAFATWIVGTAVLYLVAVYAIIPRPAAVIAALTPYASVIYNVLRGQDGFLTAGLIGLFLVFIDRRPWLSGIFLGLLSFKPQFGILFPLALLASRNWRALASATAMSLVLIVGAAAAFGYEGWLSFVHSLVARDSSMGEEPRILVSMLGFLLTVGVTARVSWIVQVAVAVVIAAAVCAVWAKPIAHSLKAAALCIGSVMVTPYVLTYDLCILSIAVAFLVSDGLSRGFLRGERVVMFICWFGLFLLVPPLPQLIICAVLVILALRRALWLPGEAVASSTPLREAKSIRP
jgi:Glycosyltransferase family 87